MMIPDAIRKALLIKGQSKPTKPKKKSKKGAKK